MKDMPLMGLGTFIGIEADRIDDREARFELTTASILNALKSGYRHFDLAESYGNLSAIGDALKIALAPATEGGLGLKREEIWLTMKSDGPFTEEHIDALLKSVGTEYFDLFLIHHSTGRIFNSEENLERAWSNLAHIDSEKLKRIGVSNFYEPHLERLLAICERESLVKPFANEVEMNLMSKNKSLVDYCQSEAIQLIAYSPLGYNWSAFLLENPQVRELADSIGASPAQASLAWLMAKGVTVIPKSSKNEHLIENFASLKYIDAVKEKPLLSSAIERLPDGEGVTGTSIDSKQHGNQLSWEVQMTHRSHSM